jgi:FimV-like protein
LTNWKNDNTIGTLATAYAEAGDFDQAIKWLNKAIEMNPDNETRQEVLELFKQGKAYREK